MQRKLTALIALTVAATLAGCATGTTTKPAAPTTAAPITVTGTIKADGVTWKGYAAQGEECTPTTGYDDLPGSQVLVADDSGKTLGTGDVTKGTFVATAKQGVTKGRCSFAFEVPGIPAGLAFYTVSIGRRGSQKVAGTDIGQPLDLTLR